MILEKSKTIKPPKGQVEISIKESGGGIEVRRIDDGRTLVASERFNKEMYSKEMYTINKKIIKPCEKCNNSRMYAFGNLYEDEYDLIRCGCRNKLQFIKKYVDFDGTEITEEQRNFLLDKLVCPECKKSNEFIIIPKCGEVEYKCKECGESIVVNCEEYETLREKCECGNEVFVIKINDEDSYYSYCKVCHKESEEIYVDFDGTEITEEQRNFLLDKLVCPECKKSNEFIIIPKCGEVEYKCKECGESIVVNCEEYETLREKCECGNEVFVIKINDEDSYYSYCKVCHKESEEIYVDFDGSEITEEERNFILDKLVCPECKKSNEFIIIPKCGEVEYKCKECGESIVVNCEEYETLKEKCECGNEVFVLEVEREGNIDLYDSYCKKCHERSEDSYVYFDGSKIVEITEDKRSILLLEDKIKKKNRLIHRLEVKLSKKNRLIKKLKNKLNNPNNPNDGGGGGGSSEWEEDGDREKQITFNTFNNYEEEEKELELKRKKEREKQRDRGMEMER